MADRTASSAPPPAQSPAESAPDWSQSDAVSETNDSLAATSSFSSAASSNSATSSTEGTTSTKVSFHLPTKVELAHAKEELVAAIPSKEEIEKEVRKFYSDPINVAALVWYIVAIPALITICLKSVGLLKVLIPNEAVRHDWEEVALHLMNALFLLATLALFPLMARHTYLLIRWCPRDKVELRRFYCRNGGRKPKDRTHIAIVVLWGHLTAWSVLASCVYYWVTVKHERSYTVMMFLSVFSTAMSAGGILHLLMSPLSQEYDIVKEGDAAMVKLFERRYGFYSKGERVTEAQWDGRIVPDCCEDWKVAAWSLFCPICVFGHNMEQLGFGNRVVHICAFLVVLLGPVLVFEAVISVVNIGDMAKNILAACGFFLSAIGIAYGGLWRAKMRRRFRLPGTTICCFKHKTTTDVCAWFWCCWCALCQESRTIQSYTIQVNKEMDSSAGHAGDPDEDCEAPAKGEEEEDEGDWTHVIPGKTTFPKGGGRQEPSLGNGTSAKEAPVAEKMSQ